MRREASAGRWRGSVFSWPRCHSCTSVVEKHPGFKVKLHPFLTWVKWAFCIGDLTVGLCPRVCSGHNVVRASGHLSGVRVWPHHSSQHSLSLFCSRGGSELSLGELLSNRTRGQMVSFKANPCVTRWSWTSQHLTSVTHTSWLFRKLLRIIPMFVLATSSSWLRL